MSAPASRSTQTAFVPRVIRLGRRAEADHRDSSASSRAIHGTAGLAAGLDEHEGRGVIVRDLFQARAVGKRRSKHWAQRWPVVGRVRSPSPLGHRKTGGIAVNAVAFAVSFHGFARSMLRYSDWRNSKINTFASYVKPGRSHPSSTREATPRRRPRNCVSALRSARLFVHWTRRAASLELRDAGSNCATKIAKIATVTQSSFDHEAAASRRGAGPRALEIRIGSNCYCHPSFGRRSRASPVKIKEEIGNSSATFNPRRVSNPTRWPVPSHCA